MELSEGLDEINSCAAELQPKFPVLSSPNLRKKTLYGCHCGLQKLKGVSFFIHVYMIHTAELQQLCKPCIFIKF